MCSFLCASLESVLQQETGSQEVIGSREMPMCTDTDGGHPKLFHPTPATLGQCPGCTPGAATVLRIDYLSSPGPQLFPYTGYLSSSTFREPRKVLSLFWGLSLHSPSGPGLLSLWRCSRGLEPRGREAPWCVPAPLNSVSLFMRVCFAAFVV